MTFRIKRTIFYEICIVSILGMIISLGCVSYLIYQNIMLKKMITELENQEPTIIVEKDYSNNSATFVSEEILEKDIDLIKSNIYNISAEERELLAKLLYCEGRGESIDCQKAIVSVIFNRLESGKWGSSICDVIYAKGQFTPALNGQLNKVNPTQKQYDVVDYVLQNGSTLPNWVQYFRASYHFNWKGYTPYCSFSNTYFGGYYE